MRNQRDAVQADQSGLIISLVRTKETINTVSNLPTWHLFGADRAMPARCCCPDADRLCRHIRVLWVCLFSSLPCCLFFDDVRWFVWATFASRATHEVQWREQGDKTEEDEAREGQRQI